MLFKQALLTILAMLSSLLLLWSALPICLMLNPKESFARSLVLCAHRSGNASVPFSVWSSKSMSSMLRSTRTLFQLALGPDPRILLVSSD
jgi:lipopolysaccharide/colanic/teichoic acid biosynthesis glycosyltransferase